jgi:hypothetical protein
MGGVRSVVGGSALQRGRAGGHIWALGQWALALRAAGLDVIFADCDTSPLGEDTIASFFADREVQWLRIGAGGLGGMRKEPGVPSDHGLFLNIMGFIDARALGESQWLRTFLDIDPGYPQIWQALGLADMLDGHEHFVTIAENIGRPTCAIPTGSRDWITTSQPVVLDEWPVVQGGTRFTTVATWRNSYGTVTWNGETYGSRVHEFRQFFDLPRLVDAEFELALDIDAAEVDDLRALQASRWRLVDPEAVAGTADTYRSYIQSSHAEFSVAQNMYVATRSGWLSDRSLCYLASGKPVLAQDTGFSDNYPVGEGLLAFNTLDEAAAGVEEIERNYESHSRAARALAEEYFDAKKVIGRLLRRLEIEVPTHR